MNDNYVLSGRFRRKAEKLTCLYHFRVKLFYQALDLQLQELNNHFNEANRELLLSVACLNPREAFSAFDKNKLINMSKFYPNDFPQVQYSTKELENQLKNYIFDMKSSTDFSELNRLGDLAKKMVEKRKDILYPIVYKLITLALILPIATFIVERVFSAMKIVKTQLRNRMSDTFMADCLITFVEKEIFERVNVESIMRRFQDMKSRR